MLLDWSQNNGNKTTIVPYSLRGRLRPTVAAPRTWRELASPGLAQLEFDEVLRRVEKKGDPLLELSAGHLGEDLGEYRAMRDPSKTPEPMGGGRAAHHPGEPSFVIQEHHASRLHHDFRLERDGVLVSWALPKGVPTDRKTEPPRGQGRRPPARVRQLRGRHSEGGIRRRRASRSGTAAPTTSRSGATTRSSRPCTARSTARTATP